MSDAHACVGTTCPSDTKDQSAFNKHAVAANEGTIINNVESRNTNSDIGPKVRVDVGSAHAGTIGVLSFGDDEA